MRLNSKENREDTLTAFNHEIHRILTFPNGRERRTTEIQEVHENFCGKIERSRVTSISAE